MRAVASRWVIVERVRWWWLVGERIVAPSGACASPQRGGRVCVCFVSACRSLLMEGKSGRRVEVPCECALDSRAGPV